MKIYRHERKVIIIIHVCPVTLQRSPKAAEDPWFILRRQLALVKPKWNVEGLGRWVSVMSLALGSQKINNRPNFPSLPGDKL